MDEISRLRTRIDEIDQDILELLATRQDKARLLGQLKRERDLSIRDPEREKTILRKTRTTSKQLGLDIKYTTSIFNQIFKLAIQAQSSAKYSRGLTGKKVLIVGGTGGMGHFFARFLRANGATVKIAGRDPGKIRRVARQIAVNPGVVEDAATSDMVIVTVPISVTKRLALSAASHMRPGSLLMDLSSVKTGVADEISSKLPEGVEYVSTHPLFGPDADSLVHQNLVAVPYRIGAQWRAFAREVVRAGGKIKFVDRAAHDKTMALVQVLHHFALISFALVLRDWDGELSSSSIRTTVGNIRRLLKNWDTVTSIQETNPYADERRREFAKTVRALANWLPKSRPLEDILSVCVQKWSHSHDSFESSHRASDGK